VGIRGEITGWSKASKRRLRSVLANAGVEWRTFAHLTYPAEFPKDGDVVKRHLKRFLDAARRKGMRAYVWVLEFQERGAPHLHVLADVGQSEGFNKDWVADTWARVAGADRQAGTRVESVYSQEAVASYLRSYLAKADQKTVPEDFANVGRMWGSSEGLGRALEAGSLDWGTGARVARAVRKVLEARGVHMRHQPSGGTIYGGSEVVRRLVDYYKAQEVRQ